MLIVFEGLDGAGKSLQIERLKQDWPDIEVIKYPTKTFDILNNYLEKKIFIEPKSLFLLFLSDIANDQESIRKATRNKKTVILDRYVFSTLAYEINGIDYGEGKQIIKNIKYIVPDKVILLDIDATTAQLRKAKQKKLDRYEENSNYLDKVRSNFLKQYEERFLTPNWYKIDARKSIDLVTAKIREILIK